MRSSCIFHSGSTDPYFNHAFEEFLTRSHRPEEGPLLFTCTNAGGVVVGRNQNPWIECDMTHIARNSMYLSRRATGGGTVYQDTGNANFSIIAARREYNPMRHLDLALDTLCQLGFDATIETRRSLTCCGRKVSGSAFMLTAAATTQHATMLINANLDQLQKVLRKNAPPIATSAVASVPSAVANLTEFNPDLTTDKFYQALRQQFISIYRTPPETYVIKPQSKICEDRTFRQLLVKYQSNDWILGRSPKFSYTLQAKTQILVFHVASGKFITVAGTDQSLTERLATTLVGQYFTPEAITAAVENELPKGDHRATDILTRLQQDFPQ